MLKQLSVFFCEFMGRDEFKVYKKAKKKKRLKSGRLMSKNYDLCRFARGIKAGNSERETWAPSDRSGSQSEHMICSILPRVTSAI